MIDVLPWLFEVQTDVGSITGLLSKLLQRALNSRTAVKFHLIQIQENARGKIWWLGCLNASQFKTDKQLRSPPRFAATLRGACGTCGQEGLCPNASCAPVGPFPQFEGPLSFLDHLTMRFLQWAPHGAALEGHLETTKVQNTVPAIMAISWCDHVLPLLPKLHWLPSGFWFKVLVIT